MPHATSCSKSKRSSRRDGKVMMELSTDDFIAAFGEELQTRGYDEILAARDAEAKPLSAEEIQKALGEESYQNLKALAGGKGIHLKDLAESIGLVSKQVREGVKAGSRFPRKPGAFDAMCRQLGFEPSEARRYLGGIYEAEARDERFEARMSINEKLRDMHAVYQRIVNPAYRKVADAAIDAFWDYLNLLADSQG